MKPVRFKGLDRNIQIERNDCGVPHIRSESWLDALFGLGLMHTMDRGTQLLFARSVAMGRACEEIADTAELAETDRFFRRIGLYYDTLEEYEKFDPGIQQQLEAYCAGVNFALKRGGRTFPMWATGFQPGDWDPPSVVLIGKLLSFGGLAISQIQNERLLVELIHAGVNEQALRELFGNRLDQIDFELIQQVHIANNLSNDALELLTDLPRLAGSNAWAVAPERSQTGHALLASDPHLEINRLPAIWYEAVLHWDANYVLGATLPGCPLFAVARTADLAWGVTYMKGDTSDFFIEDCRLSAEDRWQYRREKEWLDFDVREERIQHKQGDEEVVRIFSNEQGILESDPAEFGPGYHLSLAWSGTYEGNGKAIGTWLEVLGSANVREAMHYAALCPQPTLCWVFADREGHIGRQSCGRFPIRGNGHVGLAPIPAWDPRNHWQGFRDQSDLPSEYDPPCGFVATANEEQNPPHLPRFVTQPLPDYRLRRIVERLSELDQASIDDMQQLQYDFISVRARDLLDIFLPHVPDGPTKDVLKDWNGSYHPKDEVAGLFLSFYRNVLTEVLGHEHGIGWRRMVYLCSRAGFSLMVITAADRLLMKDDSIWWKGRDKGELIRRAFEAIDPQSPVPWSTINNFHFTDRFFGNHQVGRMLGYKSRVFPMPGNHATVFQGHVLQTATREATFAPSYHFVTDLGSDEAWTNLPGGPSENRFSRYYKSDVSRWATGEYKQLSVSEPALT